MIIDGLQKLQMVISMDLLLCSASPSIAPITLGRNGIGRVYSGTVHTGDKILVVKNDGSRASEPGHSCSPFLTTRAARSAARLTQVILRQSLALITLDIGDVYTRSREPC